MPSYVYFLFHKIDCFSVCFNDVSTVLQLVIFTEQYIYIHINLTIQFNLLPVLSLYEQSTAYPTLYWWAHACMRACSVVSDSLQPHGLQPTRLLCPWDSPGKKTGVGAISFSSGFSKPGTEPALLVSPAPAGRFFTSEPPGKPILMDS